MDDQIFNFFFLVAYAGTEKKELISAPVQYCPLKVHNSFAHFCRHEKIIHLFCPSAIQIKLEFFFSRCHRSLPLCV